MLERQLDRFLLASLAIALLVLGLPRFAVAINMPAYDLDSLVYQSTEIVEGQVTRGYQLGWNDFAEIKLSAVYAGEFKVGQTVAMVLDAYQTKNNANERKPPFAKGDHLVAFLDGKTLQANGGDDKDIPKGGPIYWPVASGIKIITGDAVYGFRQWGNPGPYVPVKETDGPKGPALLPAKYPAFIHASLDRVAGWRAKFKPEATRQDLPWLLSLLKDRSALHADEHFCRPIDDVVAEDAEVRLANLHDPTALYQTLGLRLPWMQIIQYGFATPAGRDLLLAKIASPTEPKSAKLLAADTLGHIPCIYRERHDVILVNAESMRGRDTGNIDANNSFYLTRIAKLVAAQGSNGELAVELVEALDEQAQQLPQTDSDFPIYAQLRPDFDAAAAELRKAYVPGISPQLCYLIETTCADIGRAEYQNLHSTHGPVISLITRLDPAHYMAPPPPSVLFRYELTALPWITSPSNGLPDQVQLVLAPVAGGEPITMPTKASIPRTGHAEGMDFVSLPKSLPHGKYRVFLRFLARGKPVGESYGFEQDF